MKLKRFYTVQDVTGVTCIYDHYDMIAADKLIGVASGASNEAGDYEELKSFVDHVNSYLESIEEEDRHEKIERDLNS